MQINLTVSSFQSKLVSNDDVGKQFQSIGPQSVLIWFTFLHLDGCQFDDQFDWKLEKLDSFGKT